MQNNEDLKAEAIIAAEKQAMELRKIEALESIAASLKTLAENGETWI